MSKFAKKRVFEFSGKLVIENSAWKITKKAFEDLVADAVWDKLLETPCESTYDDPAFNDVTSDETTAVMISSYKEAKPKAKPKKKPVKKGKKSKTPAA